VPEKRLRGRIFGPERDDMTGGCRKLHNEELHVLCSSPIIRTLKVKGMRWVKYEGREGGKIISRYGP
jgi:hypothetical protein